MSGGAGATPAQSGPLNASPSCFDSSAWRRTLCGLTVHLLLTPAVSYLRRGEKRSWGYTVRPAPGGPPSWIPLCLSIPLLLPQRHRTTKPGDMRSILQGARPAPCASHVQPVPAAFQMPAIGCQDEIGKRVWMIYTGLLRYPNSSPVGQVATQEEER